MRVRGVAAGSIADEIGIAPDAVLQSVNGIPIRDEVDYLYAADCGGDCVVAWTDPDGTECECVVEDYDGEDLGLDLCTRPVRTCRNKCVFCFVDQMPRGMRPTLYIKDDDWRSSFLHGTYITLTNLSEDDITRIIDQRISPLYVSVHATDDAVRARLLGTKRARDAFAVLRRLTDAGIQVEAQAVVCGGINDGKILERTIDDLFALHPAVRSLSVVPVGLTRHRERLPDVAPITVDNARSIVRLVEDRQRRFLEQSGTRFVFAADELYLRSGEPLPPYEAYEDFRQIENGVGLVADFEARALEALESTAAAGSAARILLLTGTAFAPRLRRLAGRAAEKLGTTIEVRSIENAFFGPTVTVAGLLTGQDVARAAQGAADDGFDAVFVPEIMFRDDGERALDDVAFADVEHAAGIPCFKASSEGDVFIRQLERVQPLF